MKTNIIVRFEFEGIHQWKECPIEEVSFLKHPHRHIFHVVAKKTVTHDDRDIEIIQLKRKMLRFFSAHKIPAELGDASCEMIAKAFIKAFNLCYCSVLEDNENGAEVWAEQEQIDEPNPPPVDKKIESIDDLFPDL